MLHYLRKIYTSDKPLSSKYNNPSFREFLNIDPFLEIKEAIEHLKKNL